MIQEELLDPVSASEYLEEKCQETWEKLEAEWEKKHQEGKKVKNVKIVKGENICVKD